MNTTAPQQQQQHQPHHNNNNNNTNTSGTTPHHPMPSRGGYRGGRGGNYNNHNNHHGHHNHGGPGGGHYSPGQNYRSMNRGGGNAGGNPANPGPGGRMGYGSPQHPGFRSPHLAHASMGQNPPAPMGYPGPAGYAVPGAPGGAPPGVPGAPGPMQSHVRNTSLSSSLSLGFGSVDEAVMREGEPEGEGGTSALGSAGAGTGSGPGPGLGFAAFADQKNGFLAAALAHAPGSGAGSGSGSGRGRGRNSGRGGGEWANDAHAEAQDSPSLSRMERDNQRDDRYAGRWHHHNRYDPSFNSGESSGGYGYMSTPHGFNSGPGSGHSRGYHSYRGDRGGGRGRRYGRDDSFNKFKRKPQMGYQNPSFYERTPLHLQAGDMATPPSSGLRADYHHPPLPFQSQLSSPADLSLPPGPGFLSTPASMASPGPLPYQQPFPISRGPRDRSHLGTPGSNPNPGGPMSANPSISPPFTQDQSYLTNSFFQQAYMAPNAAPFDPNASPFQYPAAYPTFIPSMPFTPAHPAGPAATQPALP
ncbi:hypothetical protein KEM55_004786 [Ascosphaera atra]|nr:hypothetical protein KEM55_004786 [Ascosphaera atra]